MEFSLLGFSLTQSYGNSFQDTAISLLPPHFLFLLHWNTQRNTGTCQHQTSLILETRWCALTSSMPRTVTQHGLWGTDEALIRCKAPAGFNLGSDCRCQEIQMGHYIKRNTCDAFTLASIQATRCGARLYIVFKQDRGGLSAQFCVSLCITLHGLLGTRGSTVVKNPPAVQETRLDHRVRKIPWRRKWQPAPAFLPEKFHGQRILVGYNHGVKKE